MKYKFETFMQDAWKERGNKGHEKAVAIVEEARDILQA